jgi:hypothetical protein
VNLAFLFELAGVESDAFTKSDCFKFSMARAADLLGVTPAMLKSNLRFHCSYSRRSNAIRGGFSDFDPAFRF